MLALAMRERETLARTDLSSVEFVRTGSAPITQSLIDEVRHAFPNAALVIGYGTTEAGPVMFGPRPGVAKARPRARLAASRRRGAPRWHRMAEETDEGELWIRTPANMAGYLNLPAKTQEVLTADGWYKSGGRVPPRRGGCLHVRRPHRRHVRVRRREHLSGRGREPCSSGTPTSFRLASCRCPTRSRVEKPFAFVVLRPGACLTEDEVKRYALDNAPAYQHPRGVVFMTELPLATHQQGRSQGARPRSPASAGRHPSSEP